MASVEVRPATIPQAAVLEGMVPEFEEPRGVEEFEKRLTHNPLVLVAYVNGQPAGYSASYQRDDDGSYYCWSAGVLPAYRKEGVYRALATYRQNWAHAQGYQMLKIKTRNRFRSMLAFLVADGWMFDAVNPADNPQENRISAFKLLK